MISVKHQLWVRNDFRAKNHIIKQYPYQVMVSIQFLTVDPFAIKDSRINDQLRDKLWDKDVRR
jgi:hypothetical protein